MKRVLLLRGINVGAAHRVGMADLRAMLDAEGLGPARTHLASGNVVVDSDEAPDALEDRIAELIAARFGFPVPVLSRTGEELQAVLARDPIPGAAEDPRRYQVTFLAERLPAEEVRELNRLAAADERLCADGRELYASHPSGIARSALATALTAARLGVPATARNWATVRALAALSA